VAEWSDANAVHFARAVEALHLRSNEQPQSEFLNILIEKLQKLFAYFARGDIVDAAMLAIGETFNLCRLQGLLVKGQVHGDLSSAQGLIKSSPDTSLLAAFIKAINDNDIPYAQVVSAQLAQNIRWIDFEGPPAKDTVPVDYDTRQSPLIDLAGVIQGLWYISNIQLYMYAGLNPQGNAEERDVARKVSLMLSGQLSMQDVSTVLPIDERVIASVKELVF
jgi:hypothetical protein